ncbi:MAG: biopolymer transporter ExbD [Candidatus Krumholzibacteria bacterium]|nr:biopolymer transporter ExbD [Candidatus Krumholzibacteria bacterium]MDH4336088.1 biopolymer transporter ExbD [Candidatus Krumholzibacteria bacterium]MDH5268336.1 biopolymer transporter ExbD [Candidatus Krumholzibacteria bacterium]MDH5628152.1 biopolymer transporter ExbD [Candidatus Krumholzibacteria bacterium]
MKIGVFKKKQGVRNNVPTASMADIAFLLLIFFMATTIFKMEDGLEVTLPRAETAQRQQREKIMHIWINQAGSISINDKIVKMEQIEDILKGMLSERPDLIVAFNADDRAPYRVVSDVMEELKDASAVRVSFTSDKKNPNVRRRREL